MNNDCWQLEQEREYPDISRLYFSNPPFHFLKLTLMFKPVAQSQAHIVDLTATSNNKRSNNNSQKRYSLYLSNLILKGPYQCWHISAP